MTGDQAVVASCQVERTETPSRPSTAAATGPPKTLTIRTTIREWHPNQCEISDVYLPGPTTSVLTGEEIGVMNADDDASATIIANGYGEA